MLNFCLFVFILYAVSRSAYAILFRGKRRKKQTAARRRTVQRRETYAVRPKRRARVIPFYAYAKTPQRKRSSAA